MNAQQEVGRSLSKDVAHAAQFTSTAVGTFVRTAGAPVEAIAGGLGAFVGLGTAHVAGIAYPLYASAVLDLCGFGGAGLLFAIGARLLASKGRRAKEEQRRTDIMFQSHTLEMQLQTAERLPNWVSKDTKEAFAREILRTMSTTPSAQVPLPSPAHDREVANSAAPSLEHHQQSNTAGDQPLG